MPCPHGVFPDALTVSWNVSFIDLHPSKGRVVIRDAGLVRHIFHVVCGWDLTYYGAHFVRNCPAARSIETYHLRFQHGNKSALRLIERYLGCLDTGVEGRPRLGTVWVDVTSMLPQWLIEKMGGIAWSR
jgi:hypothetical protein